MRILGALSLLISLLLAVGCSTHEEKFEKDVPPPSVEEDVDLEAMVAASSAIIASYRDSIADMSADALAPLSQAAALTFRTTGAPGMRSAAREYADVLLEARVPIGGGDGFFGADEPGKADPRTTALAVDALLDVYIATNDSRYRDAVIEGLNAIVSPQLGWRNAGRGAGVRLAGDRRVDIATTAQAAQLLERTDAAPISARTGGLARRALRVVTESQAAVGRWYAQLGSRSPMDVAQWATTLFSLATLENREAKGIVGGGVPALWDAAFEEAGEPSSEAPDPAGLGAPLSLSAFQAFEGTPRYAELAMSSALAARRDDGTVDRVSTVDAPVQALYALAFARRAFDLRDQRT